MGDKVFLKLCPYRQQSVTHRVHPKLAARYYGLFEIIKRIGAVAYKLCLPTDCRVHPVFHVSQLKHVVGNHPIETTLPDTLAAFEKPPYESEAILSDRLIVRGGHSIPQLLLQWKGRSVEEASWVDHDEIASQFPSFSFGDKASVSKGGNVTGQNISHASHVEDSDELAPPRPLRVYF